MQKIFWMVTGIGFERDVKGNREKKDKNYRDLMREATEV